MAPGSLTEAISHCEATDLECALTLNTDLIH